MAKSLPSSSFDTLLYNLYYFYILQFFGSFVKRVKRDRGVAFLTCNISNAVYALDWNEDGGLIDVQ